MAPENSEYNFFVKRQDTEEKKDIIYEHQVHLLLEKKGIAEHLLLKEFEEDGKSPSNKGYAERSLHPENNSEISLHYFEVYQNKKPWIGDKELTFTQLYSIPLRYEDIKILEERLCLLSMQEHNLNLKEAMQFLTHKDYKKTYPNLLGLYFQSTLSQKHKVLLPFSVTVNRNNPKDVNLYTFVKRLKDFQDRLKY